jgi:small GTP-binding protein
MLCKVVLIGDTRVGKSCLLLRFTEGRFFPCPGFTIGIEFGTRTVLVPSKVELQIWDTAGAEMFRPITRSYYRGAHMLIVLFDVTERRSFLNLPVWINECVAFGHPEIPCILVGNKCDLVNQRQVTTPEARAFAETSGMLAYYETSAYTNENVEMVFTSGVASVLYHANKPKRTKRTCFACGTRK